MAFDYADGAFVTPLIRAVINNDRLEVQAALKKGFSANLPDNRGWTPLHEAVSQDERIDCVKELIVHPSTNINAQTFLGETPLFLACQNSCIEVVNLLLKQPKCAVNQTNTEAVSPLHIACCKGILKIVKVLIEFGANVNAQDFNGYTPLHEAVASGCSTMFQRAGKKYKICHYLLKHGAKHDIVEYEGNYPLHIACQNGHLSTVQLFHKVSKQPDIINRCNDDGRSPLMLAVQSKNLSVIETLLSLGANPNIADKRNITALHIAAHSGDYEIFNMILNVTNNECLFKYCTFNEENDFEDVLSNKRINSLICLAIDTEDLQFLKKILDSNIDPSVLQCPVVHAENLAKKSFTLHTPISFLLESKMYDLGEKTLDFLQTLINYKSPLKVLSKTISINYINPVCAALVALNDCPRQMVLKCLRMLLMHGADPDEPPGRMSFAMEQACMRGCPDAVLLLLQYSNVLEPEDVIKWIEQETSSNQEKTIEILLPLAPTYTPSDKLLPDITDSKRRKVLFRPTVHPLASYCRSVIRKQIHIETHEEPYLFTQQLSRLFLPKDLVCFLRFM